MQNRKPDRTITDPLNKHKISLSGGVKLLVFFSQTIFLLSSSYFLPTSNAHQIFSNFTYKIVGIRNFINECVIFAGLECNFSALRRSVIVDTFLIVMFGPFIISSILMALSAVQYSVKYIRSSSSVESDPLLAPKPNLWANYKLQCLSIFLYTLYFLYYGLTTSILQNMACKTVKIKKSELC